MLLYPGAKYVPTTIRHPKRSSTRGIVIHWTAGREAGDVATLDGPSVDVQFYVAKDGDVYQFMDMDSSAWHAFHTANYNTIGIETEGRGEAWTPKQLQEVAKLTAFLTKRYNIPVLHTDPSSSADGPGWHGIYGHRDLQGIDGNNHTDTVPAGTSWDVFLQHVRAYRAAAPTKPKKLTLRQRIAMGLAKAGLGPKSIKQVLDNLNKVGQFK